jgi:O-antigen/teichoic acid export membrane protein
MSSKTEGAEGEQVAPPTPRLGLNYVLLAGGEVFSKLLTTIAFAYVARVFGPAAYGELVFVLAILFFFALLVDCGLSYYGAREVARDAGAVGRLLGPILLDKILLAILAFALLAGLTWLIDAPGSTKTLLLLYGLTLFALPGLLPWPFQGRDRMHVVAGASLLRQCIFAAGVFALVRAPAHVRAMPLVEGVALLSVALYYSIILWRWFAPLRPRIDVRAGMASLSRALPIGASDLAWALRVYAPTAALGMLVGGEQVGWYGAAHRIVISLHTFAWLYFFNLAPSIARTARAAAPTLQGLLTASMRLMGWAAVGIGLAGTAFAGPIIRLLYGPEYGAAAGILRWLIWLVPLSLMSGHYRHTLIAYDLQRLEFLGGAVGAGLGVALSLALIPRLGWVGAACALLVPEGIIWALAYFFVRRRVMHVELWRHLRLPIGVGTILLIVLYCWVPANEWLVGSLVLVAYVLAVLLAQRDVWIVVRAMFSGRPL